MAPPPEILTRIRREIGRRLEAERLAFVPPLIAAGLGGFVFHLLGLPAAWMSGATVVATAYTLARGSLVLPRSLRETAFLLLGVAIGASITPEVLAGVRHWPLSIAALFLTVPLIVGTAALFLTRVMGWRPEEAFLASVPGALAFVIAVSESYGLNVRKVAVSQSIRLFVMVVLIPVAIGSSTAPVPVKVLASADLATTFAVICLALSVSLVFWKLRVPAPFMMGGFALSGILHGTRAVEAQLPQIVVILTLVVIGTNVGSRFSGTSPAELRRILFASVGAFLIAFSVAALSAYLVALAVGLAYPQVLLAFAPGGLDAMTVLAYALGVEPAFVATHQILRFVGIAMVLPLVFGPVAALIGRPAAEDGDRA
ncbi:MAG: AbrB family transcriptional regulator [Hyphomicrobiaceae bacterium]